MRCESLAMPGYGRDDGEMITDQDARFLPSGQSAIQTLEIDV